MRWGRRQFSVIDAIGDLVAHSWSHRRTVSWEDIARKLIKLVALFLVGVALVHVLYPTQKAGWLLWLGSDATELAHWTALVLVGVTAIIIPLVRYAWTEHRGLAIGGGVFACAMIVAVLLGGWNYYAYTSSRAVNVALASTGGAEAGVAESQAALAALETRAADQLALMRAELERTPENYPTGRSRIMAAMTELQAATDAERARLQAALVDRRALVVQANQAAPDPRPIDGFIASAFGQDRDRVAVGLDLFRSAVFEALALLFVSLGTTVAVSRMGAPHVPDVQMIEDKSKEPPGKVDAAAAAREYIDAIFTDAKRSEAARKGWQRRRAQQQAAEDPVLSPSDPRRPVLARLPGDDGVTLQADEDEEPPAPPAEETDDADELDSGRRR